MKEQGEQRALSDDEQRRLKENAYQIKLAIKWGRQAGLTDDESVERWTQRYGAAFRRQRNSHLGEEEGGLCG